MHYPIDVEQYINGDIIELKFFLMSTHFDMSWHLLSLLGEFDMYRDRHIEVCVFEDSGYKWALPRSVDDWMIIAYGTIKENFTRRDNLPILLDDLAERGFKAKYLGNVFMCLEEETSDNDLTPAGLRFLTRYNRQYNHNEST